MAYLGKVPADVLVDPLVTSASLVDGTIITADIANDAVTAAKLAANSVDSSELIDGSIDNGHLAGSIAINKTLLAGGTGLTLSTNTLNVDAAQTQITSVGTIGTGVWQGTAVASAYLDADTAHLSGTQTFSGAKTFSSAVNVALSSGNNTTSGLYIYNSNGAAQIRMEGGSDEWIFNTTYSTNTLAIQNKSGNGSTNTRLSIDTSGKIGIGTASPDYKIHSVVGASGFNYYDKTGDDKLEGLIELTGGGNSGMIKIYDGGGANDIKFTAETDASSFINNGGKFGIGTATPTGLLQIEDSSDAYNYLSIRNTRGAGSYAGIMFSHNATANREKAAFYALETKGEAHYQSDFVWALRGGGGDATQVSSSDEKMRLTSAGKVGIGTASPDKELHVYGGNDAGVHIQSSNGGSIKIAGEATGSSITAGSNQYIRFLYDAGSTEAMRIIDGGNVGIGVTNPGHPLDIKGDNASGYAVVMHNDGNNANRSGMRIECGTDDQSGVISYITCNDGDGNAAGVIENSSGTFQLRDTSDARLKDNIRDTSTNGLTVVNGIKIRDFEWKNNKVTVNAGFIAQELKEVFPQAVGGELDEVDDRGKMQPLGVAKDRLVPVLVKAVQELSAKVTSLENA